MDTDTYWKSQWANFCPHFKDGIARINLADYGGPDTSFNMVPGGGFGDLSHPTTKLCLNQICKLGPTPFIDIGCGSGVLSLAAYKLGLNPIIAIDIDENAITHAKKNRELNSANITIASSLPALDSFEKPTIVMNMISSEAELAWESVKALHDKPKTLITSGILTEHKQNYLETRPTSYGALTFEISMDGWSLFVFSS